MNQTTKTAMLNNDIYSGNGENGALQKFYEPEGSLNNNTDTMAQIQAQNVLSAVHHQFHHNQGKYIDLLSKMVGCQATLLERYQNSPALPEVMQNLEQILQILQINQSHYNANHEGYLQNQLTLIRGGQFSTNTSNTLNNAPLNQVPNYPITSTETALPPSLKPEEQKSRDASASPSASNVTTPPVTEQLPQVPPSSNTLNNAPPSRVPNDPTTSTETALSPSLKPEGQKTIDASASQSASSIHRYATVSTSPKITPTLQPIAITSKTISHPVETKKPFGQDASASQLASSTPKSATAATLVKVTPTLEQVTTISKTINHSVESTSSTNVPSTAPVAPEVSVPSTNSVNMTKVSHRLLEVVSEKTGYPIDMLDMDMDLEADLGIDSIKQIQIFASMQDEFPDLVLDTEDIAELRTLAKITDYLKEYLSTDQTTQPSDNLHQQVAIERQIVKKNS